MSSIELRGELVNPQTVTERPRLPQSGRLGGSSLPFSLVHQHEWEFAEDEAVAKGGEWLPAYTEMRKQPGGNGVVERGHGPNARIDDTAAEIGMSKKGGIIIRRGDPRLGQYANFLARYDMQGGGYFYCLAGVRMSVSANGRRATPRPDRAWLVGLQRQLIRGGFVGDMPREALDEHLLVLENRLQRWSDLVSKGDMTKDAYDLKSGEVRGLIERMTAAFERQFGERQVAASAAPAVVAEPELLVEDDNEVMPEPAEPAAVDPRKRGR